MKDSNELFELCKQVYEVTGWENTKDGFFDGGEVMPFTDRIGAYIGASNFRCPLYTSDYLLEKLPATVKNDFDGGNDYIILYKKGKSWYADYMGQFKRQKSGTPLKALLKLTLKLHEEGIL